MAFVDLTQEQQDVLTAFIDTQLRPWAGSQARLNLKAAAANDVYNGTVTAILGELLGSDEVPNNTGLDGAEALTKDEIISLVSHIQTVVGNDGAGGVNTAAHRQLAAKAIGGVNITG